MNHLELLTRILAHDEPAAALEALAGWPGVWSARWTAADGSTVASGTAAQELAGAGDADDAVPSLVRRHALGEGREGVVIALDGEGELALVTEPGLLRGDEVAARIAEALTRVIRRGRERSAAAAEREALRRRAEESEALHMLGLAANRSLDPDEVLQVVARFSRTLLGAHYVVVNTLRDDGVHAVASVGLRTETLPQGDALAARAIDTGKPVTLGGAELDAPAYAFHAAQGMRAGLGVPLSLFGATFGALVVGYRRAYEPASRDIRLALTLAGHAAVAISNARLHRDLAERSRELERAYEELRWTAQAKERFFATMSHELRTPLNAILGYQSLLLDGLAGELSTPQRGFVESGNRATRTLLLLVNDVLDLSKIEAGKMELAFREIALAEVVREALATMRPLAEQKEIQLHEMLPAEPLTMETDPDRVHQILLNLLSNAVKFTDHGRVQVEVARVQHAGGGGDGVEIRVRDTGPGIAHEDQERIFHEFEQVAGATARGGTGLGLPISRKLARLLGGELSVESRPGAGSSFVLRLPLERTEPAGTGVATG